MVAPAGESDSAAVWVGAALEAALGDLVERHESLRTIFPDTLGVPRQLILPASAARPRLAVTTVSAAMLPEALATAAEEGFDLATEPPLRAHLFAVGAEEHVLLLLLHHIAGDADTGARAVGDRVLSGGFSRPRTPLDDRSCRRATADLRRP